MFLLKDFSATANLGKTENCLRMFTYHTTDTFDQVKADNYFLPIIATLKPKDWIFVNLDEGLVVLRVVSKSLTVIKTEAISDLVIHADIDDLGDQVAAIQAMIPDDASEENQLLTALHAVLKDSEETQVMTSGLETPSVSTDDLHVETSMTVDGTAEFEMSPLTADLTTYDAATDDSLIRKEQVAEVKDDLEDKIDQAATSGKIIGSFWFGKTKAATTVPAPTIIGQNYYDFTTGNWYETTDGATWTLGGTITPPADIDAQILITSLFWDIIEMDNQHGGKGFWSHTDSSWSYFPNIYTQPQAGSGVNVGDRFITTRLDNELNGAVECNGATYNASDVNGGNNNIIQLLTDGKLDYISMAAYAAEITANGFCKHIGWDGTGSDTFRVPTLTPRIVQKNNIPVYGDGKPFAGAAFETGSLVKQTNAVTVTQYQTGSGQYRLKLDDYNTEKTFGLATKDQVFYPSGSYHPNETVESVGSGLITDLTNKATTERVMIQLFNGATDEAVATCTSVLADVAELKYDYVVDFQRPTAENNYTWYRKYKSGWVEQGGIAQWGSPIQYGSADVTFPISMSDSNYDILLGGYTGLDGGNYTFFIGSVKSTTGVRIWAERTTGSNIAPKCHWQVSGMAA